MRNITFGVIFRVLFILAIIFYLFYQLKLSEWNYLLRDGKILFLEYEAFRKNSLIFFYIYLALLIPFWLIIFWNRKYLFSGNLNLKEIILPEFKHSDERESVLTGKAAKAGLAITFVYSILVLSAILFPSYENMVDFMFFGTASIPIVGLLSYYISYRYYYSR